MTISAKMLIFSAMTFLGCGAWAFIAPHSIAEALHLIPDGIGGRNEVRANYGGMLSGIGLFFLYCARHPKHHTTGWFLLALLCGGLAGGRAVSMVLDGMIGGMHLVAFISEVLLTLMALYFYNGRPQMVPAASGQPTGA